MAYIEEELAESSFPLVPMDLDNVQPDAQPATLFYGEQNAFRDYGDSYAFSGADPLFASFLMAPQLSPSPPPVPQPSAPHPNIPHGLFAPGPSNVQVHLALGPSLPTTAPPIRRMSRVDSRRQQTLPTLEKVISDIKGLTEDVDTSTDTLLNMLEFLKQTYSEIPELANLPTDEYGFVKRNAAGQLSEALTLLRKRIAKQRREEEEELAAIETAFKDVCPDLVN